MRIKTYENSLILIMAIAVLVIAGCASIVSKSNYPISVKSEPTGAIITVTDSKGITVYQGSTPANFRLKAGAGFFAKANYTITFKKEGYETSTVPVYFSLDGWYIGNLLFGGLIGMLIVDPATGAMWKLDTPFIHENLSQSHAENTEPGLRIMNINDVPEKWRDKLVRVN